MSKFAQALDQARRDQALRSPALTSEARGDHAPEAAAADGPPTVRVVDPPPTTEIAGVGLDAHLVSLVTPATFEAEQYRALRHAVEQMRRTANLQVVAVSSPAIGDGKTTTAINLAGALAQSGDARTLLIEADLREPSLAYQLGHGPTSHPGLVDAILDTRLALADVVETRPMFNLSFVRAGHTPPSPYELLKSRRLGELLDEARTRFDYVIVDTPPLVPLQDCRLIAHCVDGFLLVVAANRTPRALVEEAFRVIEPSKMVGLVFNGSDDRVGGYYSRYDRPYRHAQSPLGNRRSSGGLTRVLVSVSAPFRRRDLAVRAPTRSLRNRW